MNLLSNAFKFTAKGSITVRARTDSETADDVSVTVSVTDTGIGVSEEQHGRDPSARILEGKARRLHLVLLDVAAAQVVDAALGIDLGLVGTGDVGELGAVEDVEVVVGGVAAGVAFGADGCAENDEIFGDAWLDGQQIARVMLWGVVVLDLLA